MKIQLSQIVNVWAGTEFLGITVEHDGCYIEAIEPEKKLIRRAYRIFVTDENDFEAKINEWEYVGKIKAGNIVTKFWACDLIPRRKNSLQNVKTNVNLVT